METKKKVRLSIIPRDHYPTFQKIRGSSASLPSGWPQVLGGRNDVQQGWETEGKGKSGKRKLGGPCVHCAHPSILFSRF